MANTALAHRAPTPIDTIPAIREEDALIAAEAAVTGDWSKLAPAQRIQLYGAVCNSMGLNPLTQPFGWFSQGGKLVLYAFKGATDQLRKLHGVNVVSVAKEVDGGLLITTVQVQDQTGRSDMDIGAVPFGPELKGEARANAIMKSLTKAKRRATLSLVGLGILDESEVGSVPGARRAHLDMSTGEVLGTEPIEDEPAAPKPRSAASATATVGGPDRDEAKGKLWHLANKTYGWNEETLNLVAIEETKQPLRGLDANGLKDLFITLSTMTPDARQQLVERATAIESPQLDGMS